MELVKSNRYYRVKRKTFSENTRLNPATGCLEWTGSRYPQGYGRALRVVGEPAEPRAHRRAWMMAHGDIPKGLSVLHKCDNPCCVNPSHLFLGTDADNTRDMISKGRDIRLAGGEHGRSRLDMEDVLRIREAILFGATKASLARAWGVSDTAISLIAKRRNWAHLRLPWQ